MHSVRFHVARVFNVMVSSFDNSAKLEVKLPHWRAINDETALVKTSLECASVYYSNLVLRLMNDKDRHTCWVKFSNALSLFPLTFRHSYSALLCVAFHANCIRCGYVAFGLSHRFYIVLSVLNSIVDC